MTRTFFGGLIILAAILLPSANWLMGQNGDLLVGSPLSSCARPNILNARDCRQVEEKILNATVRITVETWMMKEDESGYAIKVTGGHATVKDGRYLITHNHFAAPLSIRRRDGEPESSSVIYVYDVRGQLLLKAPLAEFELILEGDEVLVFAHREAGFFDELGLESAEFKDGRSFPVREGLEVAQIDWDGRTTRVDWTTVKAVQQTDGTPVLVLGDGALPGASGGGIFWNGFHVANNWRIEEQIDAAGDLIDTITVVALNTAAVTN